MTQEQFNNYFFNNKTEIKIWDVDKFYKVLAVDFERNEIEFELGITDISNVKEIRY
jgi:hypothetical protein